MARDQRGAQQGREEREDGALLAAVLGCRGGEHGPTFPTSAPFVQSGPVWSMKVRVFALTLLKRVGKPKTIAS